MGTQAPAFSLAQAARAVVAQRGAGDLHGITDELAAAIPDSALREVVRKLLPAYVRNLTASLRRWTGEPGPTKSDGWDAVRALSRDPKLWRPPFANGKTLADCTAEDCDEIVGKYMAFAAQQESWAKKYRRLAETIREAGVETVGELPDETVREVFSG